MNRWQVIASLELSPLSPPDPEREFGSWVLLQPGVQTMRVDERERGCLTEERVLGGDLTYHRPEERLSADEDRFVLLAMHKILVDTNMGQARYS